MENQTWSGERNAIHNKEMWNFYREICRGTRLRARWIDEWSWFFCQNRSNRILYECAWYFKGWGLILFPSVEIAFWREKWGDPLNSCKSQWYSTFQTLSYEHLIKRVWRSLKSHFGLLQRSYHYRRFASQNKCFLQLSIFLQWI